MRYMRIPQNKFWGWVVASTLVGLAVGLVIMFASGAAATNRIAALEAQLSGAGTDTSAAVAAAESRAASAEASVASLTEQVDRLMADLAAAKGTKTSQDGAGTPATETGAVTITSCSVTPSSVSTTGTITLTVKVKGSPGKVQMRLHGISGQSFDLTYNLKKVSTSGSTQTWRRVMDAPSKVGTYRYYGSAFLGDVRAATRGLSTFTFKVH
jgi:hypothetical protein